MDVTEKIINHLKEIDRTLGWLAKMTEYNYNTLYSALVKKSMKLTDERLQKINWILGTKFKR